MNYQSTSRADFFELSVTADKPTIFTDFRSNRPAAVSVFPTPGATVYVSLSLSSPKLLAAGAGRFLVAGVGEPGTAPDGFGAGVVTEAGGFTLDAPVGGVRFIVVGGAASVEIAQ